MELWYRGTFLKASRNTEYTMTLSKVGGLYPGQDLGGNDSTFLDELNHCDRASGFPWIFYTGTTLSLYSVGPMKKKQICPEQS
jgi:hypothetical protein